MSNAAFQRYFQAVEKIVKANQGTEHTCRPALKALLEELIAGITATNEPKRIHCGVPDYVLERDGLTIGYVEAKDIDKAPLDKIENSEQLVRYRRALSNLVLTDYLEFRWYVQGEKNLAEKKMTARLATKAGNTLIFDKVGAANVVELLTCFLEHKPVAIRKPEDLAKRMARLTHMVHDVIVAAFQCHEASQTVRSLIVAFDKVVLPGITEEQFADMFAQTLAYSLFAARYNHNANHSFTRYDATREIPQTNPFLRKLFEILNSSEMDDEPFVGFVDELAQVLDATRMDEVLANFGKRTQQEDPIIHFYETFLSEYNPKLRELRGVYYTPGPVISYMVRSVDYLLKAELGIEDGLADGKAVDYTFTDSAGRQHTDRVPRVLILDPACGTGTFLSSIIEYIRASYRASHSPEMWSAYVRESLLPRLFGFELLMASYAMAHLRLGMQLAGLDLPPEQRGPWKYSFDSDARLGVYLTNSLSAGLEQTEPLLMNLYISDEANEAALVKQHSPIMVIIGNPPYNYESANQSWKIEGRRKVPNFIGELLRDYYTVDGASLNERNPKGLQDDYVKFLRFAQWRLTETGYGILAFITNHGYIDNLTFRGMRQSLLRSFDDIYILNLHGNSKKHEITPNGLKDENVFDIQQGVAISLFVKRPGDTLSREAHVHYADLWGQREGYHSEGKEQQLVGGKYRWLATQDIVTTQWSTVKPQAPFYFLKPQNTNLQMEYEQGLSITSIFPVNSGGLYTARDVFTIHWTKDEVWNTVLDFIRLAPEDARKKYNLGEDTQDWKVVLAQKDVQMSGPSQHVITPVLYRPFDVRYTYYTGHSRGFLCRPRNEVMHHMLAKENIGLITNRQVNAQFQHVFCANMLTNDCTVSSATKERSYLFPLYLYPDKSELTGISDGPRRPNLSKAFTRDFTSRLALQFIPDDTGDLQATFGPEDIYRYMYALFHSPTYRERYAEFLKIDFPRLPLTSNVELFRALCIHGKRLVELHLLEKVARPTTGFEGQGEYRVEKVEYIPQPDQPEIGSVWINKRQYFTDVAVAVWAFHIGGYQVCQKWLKDRKGRVLALPDLRDYQKIVSALSETIELMERIDEAIEEHSGWPIK